MSKERNDTLLRDVELVSYKIDNFDNYDTVIIGYPIRWGLAAWPINVCAQQGAEIRHLLLRGQSHLCRLPRQL